MAQEFVVLQCCQCHTYQVHQSKKATKWLCKMCGQKQSFKHFFGRGSAKDCRLAVQTLNRQQFSDNTIEGVVIHVNNGFNTTADDIDSRILDQILAAEDNYDSCDDMSNPKKQKMSDEEVDENIESNGLESKKNLWNQNNNLFVSRRVNKWTEFMAK